MTRPSWRLLLDGDLAGARNMARDVAILEALTEGAASPTLRLYGWAPPCLTLGRHQGVEAADLEFCRSRGVDVARRPTGGRALLHHLELTYSLIAPLGAGPIPRHLQEAYRRICEPLVDACRALGVAAELTPGEVSLQLPGPTSTVPCFQAPAGGEVVVAGRKLIGSAMRSHGGAILQHGAILLDWDSELQAGTMGLEDDRFLRPTITTFAEQLGAAPDRAVLEQALVEAFSTAFEVAFQAGELTPAETARELELKPKFHIQTRG
jgi:lipoate-protein ligase A